VGREFIELQYDGPLARLVLDRPERRNALSLALMREFIDALDEASAAPGARVLVVEGRGPAFCAGHDLAEMTGTRDADFYEELFTTCVRMMLRLHEVPQPVIAKVHGVATAAGCQLVAACDLRAIGRKHALEMLFTGDLIDAHTALDWGLVNRVVPAGELDDVVTGLATHIAAASPYVLALGKRAFYAQDQLTEDAAYAIACPAMVENAEADDAYEGMRAFLEKRVPTWPKH
jgi:enoyl-CoA hydratase/carnithine racemase